MVKLNPDKKVVEAVKEGLKQADIAPAAANGRKITSASVANSANRSPIPNSKAFATVCCITNQKIRAAPSLCRDLCTLAKGVHNFR